MCFLGHNTQHNDRGKGKGLKLQRIADVDHIETLRMLHRECYV